MKEQFTISIPEDSDMGHNLRYLDERHRNALGHVETYGALSKHEGLPDDQRALAADIAAVYRDACGHFDEARKAMLLLGTDHQKFRDECADIDRLHGRGVDLMLDLMNLAKKD